MKDKLQQTTQGSTSSVNTRYNALIEETEVATVYEVSSADHTNAGSEPIEQRQGFSCHETGWSYL